MCKISAYETGLHLLPKFSFTCRKTCIFVRWTDVWYVGRRRSSFTLGMVDLCAVRIANFPRMWIRFLESHRSDFDRLVRPRLLDANEFSSSFEPVLVEIDSISESELFPWLVPGVIVTSYLVFNLALCSGFLLISRTMYPFQLLVSIVRLLILVYFVLLRRLALLEDQLNGSSTWTITNECLTRKVGNMVRQISWAEVRRVMKRRCGYTIALRDKSEYLVPTRCFVKGQDGTDLFDYFIRLHSTTLISLP